MYVNTFVGRYSAWVALMCCMHACMTHTFARVCYSFSLPLAFQNEKLYTDMQSLALRLREVDCNHLVDDNNNIVYVYLL